MGGTEEPSQPNVANTILAKTCSLGRSDQKVRVQERTIFFKSILNTFLQGTKPVGELDLNKQCQVVQLSLVEVKDKNCEKFLVGMTSG